MARVVLGTLNPGKIEEAMMLLRSVPGLILLTHEDTPFQGADETGTTFLENAWIKARAVGQQTGLPSLSEDSGLEVSALQGEPGVRSARYAGAPSNASKNNACLLSRLKGQTDRTARFITVAVLYLPDGQVFASSGVLSGMITEDVRGTGGFGYDPLFLPEGETRTLAEMPREEKNRISHRYKALIRMRPLLETLVRDGELSSGRDR
jgi:XTP/dITP diphosphohydrolase